MWSICANVLRLLIGLHCLLLSPQPNTLSTTQLGVALVAPLRTVSNPNIPPAFPLQAVPSLPPQVQEESQPTPVGVSGDELLVFNRESGNNPGAINPSSGACGLGQAEPCSKLPCSLSDYNCQVNYFTGYMEARYGSWEASWQHELDFGWW